MTTEFTPAIYEDGRIPDIFVARDPNIVMQEAQNAAKVLMAVVRAKPKEEQVIIGKKQYLEFQDWQTVANFYGCTVRVRSTNFLDYGGVKGFEATADVLNRNGVVISTGDAMCLNDEEKWGMRAKYEWKDKLDTEGKKIWNKAKNRYEGTREKVGEEPTPLFQLRSMAQTRACAKAIRNVFSWVVVLAGYAPVAAEEMTGNEEGGQKKEGEGIREPQEKKPDTSQSTNPDDVIIENKVGKMLFAKFKGKGIDTAEMNAKVAEWYSTPDLVLFKLPLRHVEDCKHRIDELPDPEPGSNG
jgi:hypothetical protein